jgi:small subunit ribosomal protein S17
MTAKEKSVKATKSNQAPKEKAAPVAAAPKAVVDAQVTVRRELVGTVVSDKMQKTIVVKVDRRVRHGLYAKYVTNSRRFKAHDETNEARIGDLVVIVESRPLSRDKRWALKNIVRRAAQVGELKI